MRVPAVGPGKVQVDGVQTDDEVADEAFSHESEERATSLEKRVVNRRKAQLVRRLKSRRKYAPPVKGGRGKQARTRGKRFG